MWLFSCLLLKPQDAPGWRRRRLHSSAPLNSTLRLIGSPPSQQHHTHTHTREPAELLNTLLTAEQRVKHGNLFDQPWLSGPFPHRIPSHQTQHFSTRTRNAEVHELVSFFFFLHSSSDSDININISLTVCFLPFSFKKGPNPAGKKEKGRGLCGNLLLKWCQNKSHLVV